MLAAPHVLTFPASSDGFEAAFAGLRGWLDDNNVQQKARYNAELVFEEIVTNIIRYGFEKADGETVNVELGLGADVIEMTFDDGGAPFDPLAAADPDLPNTLDDAKIGGLGIMLVRKAATDLIYEQTAQHRNRLTVKLAAD